MALQNLRASRFRVWGMSSFGLRRHRQRQHQHQHRHQYPHQHESSFPRLRSTTSSTWGSERRPITAATANAVAASTEASESSCSKSRNSQDARSTRGDDSSTHGGDDSDFTKKFGDPRFWEGEYSSQLSGDLGEHAPFEWFLSYEGGLREHLLPFLESMSTTFCTRLLHVGCGTSEMGPKLAQEPSLLPLIHVTDSDTSPSALTLMRRRHAALHNYACHQGNAVNLDFPDDSFDAVVDKGTLDALLCRSVEDAHLMVGEMHRVLRKGGVYFQISAEDPEARLELLTGCRGSAKGERGREETQQDPWARSFFKELGDGAESAYFMYVLVK